MPLVSTKGAASAQGFGFSTFSGSPYWVGQLSQGSGNVGGPGNITASSSGVLAYPLYTGSTSDYCVCTITPQATVGWVSAYRDATSATYGEQAGSAYILSDNTVISTGLGYTSGSVRDYIMRYNSSGSLTSQTYASGDNDPLQGRMSYISFDASGNYYHLYQPYTGLKYNSRVTKFNSSNVVQWGKLYTDINNYGKNYGSVRFERAVVDSSNNVYLGGSSANISEGNGAGRASIYKLNSSGTQQWANVYLGPSAIRYFYSTHIIDASNNLFLLTSNDNNTDRVIVNQINTTTGGLTGTPIYFSLSDAQLYSNANYYVDSSNNIYIAASSSANASTVFYIMRIAAGFGSATAIKVTISGSTNTYAFPYSLTTGGGYLWVSIANPTGSAGIPRLFCLSSTLSDNVGKTAVYSGRTYTISNVTPTLTTYSAGSTGTSGGTASTSATWSNGTMISSSLSLTASKTNFS